MVSMKIEINSNNIKTDDLSVYNNGEKYSYNNRGQYHNIDGPYHEWSGGDESWILGKEHRKYGPARKWRNFESWYFEGKYYSMKEFMEKFL